MCVPTLALGSRLWLAAEMRFSWQPTARFIGFVDDLRRSLDAETQFQASA